jgi:ubiquinone/menaquinone biosynthesis C-methylase UbiE
MSFNKRKATLRKFIQDQNYLEFYDARACTAWLTDKGWQEVFITLASYCNGFESVLDVGCGPYELMVVRNNNTAVGADSCKAALITLKKNGFQGQVVQASSQKLPFKQNSFGCVVCNQMIEHLTTVESIKQSIGEMERVSGNIMVVTPNSIYRRRIYDPTHFFFFNTRSLKEIMPDFEIYASGDLGHQTLDYYLLYSNPRLRRIPHMGNLVKLLETIDSSRPMKRLNKRLWVGANLIAIKSQH